jgi:hypothetical protein
MMKIQIPDYIDSVGIVSDPIDFPWSGARAHIGPVETVNKMFNMVGYKTTCGMLTQAAGIIEWGAWRLSQHAEVSVLLQMIQASFAFQVHPDYVDRNAARTRAPEDEPAAQSAVDQLQLLLWRGLSAKEWWQSYYQPHDSAFHSAYLVRHIMHKSKKKVFSKWLEGMLDRIKEVAPKPNEPFVKKKEMSPQEQSEYYARHWGEPLPPQVLDMSSDYDHTRREEFVDRYLRELDWKGNPFLRSPEAMKELGFEGTPYRLS